MFTSAANLLVLKFWLLTVPSPFYRASKVYRTIYTVANGVLYTPLLRELTGAPRFPRLRIVVLYLVAFVPPALATQQNRAPLKARESGASCGLFGYFCRIVIELHWFCVHNRERSLPWTLRAILALPWSAVVSWLAFSFSAVAGFSLLLCLGHID